MSPPATAVLYSPPLLALAVELADYPLIDDGTVQAETRSRTCGSVLRLTLALDAAERIAAVGLRVSACAVGQAAAAIFASGAAGREESEIAAARASIGRWLSGEGDRPDWPRLDLLDPAVPHAGRHEAILLPWKAACEALSMGGAAR